MPMNELRPARLVLADGTLFEGEAIGAESAGGVVAGEVVFNTASTGYQEILTDPSYAGQIITFTSPHIGNYGVVADDDEARQPFARGIVVRDLARRRSSWRSTDDLDALLRRQGVPGIAGIDTRRLTRVLRVAGAMPGAFGTAAEPVLRAAAAAERGTAGVNLVAQVTTAQRYTVGSGALSVVAIDYGIKQSILRCMAADATVHVLPAQATAAEVLQLQPDGVFLSNGPGDPELVTGAPQTIREIVAAGMPVFGICLGHQLLALAHGARIFKLPFGHHGANHPVRNLRTGRVEITSQNHNFCVAPESLAAVADVTHINLNDQTNEGLRLRGRRAFSVQYHPEAGPGPHDARYLFAEFFGMLQAR